MLAVVETHPIQYHAPVYRAVAARGVPVTAVYGSDFSVAGYRDREFGVSFAWDVDLLSGYDSRFLSRVGQGGATSEAEVSARGVGNALADLDPAAVMIVGYSPSFHRQAWRAAWKQRRPILFRGEVNDAARSRGPLRAGVRRAGLALAYRSCARCLYIGAEAREHFERHGVEPDRLEFSPYCVDDSAFTTGEADREAMRREKRARLGIAADAQVILFSGKLSPRKGVDLLVDAVRGLEPRSGRGIVLVFVGDGDLRPALEEAAAAEPSVDARFTGFQNQRALSAFYHAADALALPSREAETWGLVVNEALMHGVPVVVSDRVGCHRDLVAPGSTGRVFRSGDVTALRSGLEEVLALASAPGVRDACREKVSGYSVGAAADGIVRAYEAVLTSAGQVA